MNIIVAVDRNFGIGREGGLIYRIPEDMKHFRRMTMGRTVVMGRRTLFSLPGGRPLKDRANIVLTGDRNFEVPGAHVCHDLPELMETLRNCDTDDVFVIGGQSVYEQLIGYCSTAYVTKIDAALPADRFFPDIDRLEGWRAREALACGEHEGTAFTIWRYENSAPASFSPSVLSHLGDFN